MVTVRQVLDLEFDCSSSVPVDVIRPDNATLIPSRSDLSPTQMRLFTVTSNVLVLQLQRHQFPSGKRQCLQRKLQHPTIHSITY